MTSYVKSKRFTCTGCDIEITNRQLLKSHMLLCDKIKLFECKECKETFIIEGEYKYHADGPKCKLCNYKMCHNKVHLNIHPKCNNCNKSFLNNEKLNTHHCSNKPIVNLDYLYRQSKCKYCYKHFTSKEELKSHKVFIMCALCDENIYKCIFGSHLEKHSDIIVRCKMCGYLIDKSIIEEHKLQCK